MLLTRRLLAHTARRPAPARRAASRAAATASADPHSLSVIRHTPPPASLEDAGSLEDALRAAGFKVRTVTFAPGHVLSGHAHSLPRKRLAVAAGRFVIAPGDATPGSGTPLAAVLEAGDMVDIPAGWRHSAWVEGEDAVTLVMGDG